MGNALNCFLAKSEMRGLIPLLDLPAKYESASLALSKKKKKRKEAKAHLLTCCILFDFTGGYVLDYYFTS